MDLEPVTVAIGRDVLDALGGRLRATRWPRRDAAGDELGPRTAELRDLCDWWADGFDWPAAERRVNRARHLLVRATGGAVHVAVHSGDDRPPLLLVHGWPSSFLEFERLVPLLAPRTVVVASLPGYGWSERPPGRWTTRDTAGLLADVMAALGYRRFVAHGTDFGSDVASWLALDRPGLVAGLHLSNADLGPTLAPGEEPAAEERDYLDRFDGWWQGERGYKEIQATRPGALVPALLDSPAGLAAWVLDKWAAWTDPALGPTVSARTGRDALPELLTWWWATGTAETSVLDYADNRAAGTTVLPAGARIEVPTAVARFGHERGFREDPPRSWLERMYRLERWTDQPRGGHFAALEAPELLAADLLAFAEDLS
ncbi:epoxide hydrolase family protein [Jiangella sp. DSM 45060]|uniref:epoxide hydrolase family protein n=1 Tax=Jiangella sp. DSM 45060 TaxID=1798224 RepID=UPI0008794038|nr:epoxide hydrolase [Jiangella sp. DSM 45060]SDT24547.1 epoxide hydrolase [Jiangella sp. DSM 45060]